MITKLAQKTVDALCGSQMIGEEDKDLYIYGFFVLYSRLFFLIITVLFSLVFGIVWQGILMYIVFSLIRSYAGGVHASKESICLITTSLSILLCVVLIKTLIPYDNTAGIQIVLLGEWCCIVILSPVDTPEKRLSKLEKKRYKLISCVIATCVTIIACTFAYLRINGISIVCLVSLGFESVLLGLSRIKSKGLN